MLLIDELLLQNNYSYFGQNMDKNALFLFKNCKIAQLRQWRGNVFWTGGAENIK